MARHEAQSTSVKTPDSLVGLMDGFHGWYRPTKEDWRAAYTEGLVVLDANALLDLYRLSPVARGEMFAVLELLKDRLFVPHQVASEFHRRRIDAVADRKRELETAMTQLDELRQRVKSSVRRVAQRAHGGDARAHTVQESVARAFDDVSAFVQQVSDEHDLDPDSLLSAERDPVLSRLLPLLEGKVAPPPPAETLAEDQAEGERRAKAKIPPGFKDSGKESNAHGDYLWWAEVKRRAAGHHGPVMLVSNDVSKGDWTLDQRGLRVGPHPDLVTEIRAVTTGSLLLCTTAELLSEAQGYLAGVTVSEGTLAESKALKHDSGAGDTQSAQWVPAELVPAVLSIQPARLIKLLPNGGLPPIKMGTVWHWTDVQRAEMLVLAKDRGWDDALTSLALHSLSTRVAAHNQLVITEQGVSWVRSKDVKRFVEDLDSEPLLVLDWREHEAKLRSRQRRFYAFASPADLTFAGLLGDVGNSEAQQGPDELDVEP